MSNEPGIRTVEGIEPGDLYTTTGDDVWRVDCMFRMPSITLKNVETGELCGGAVGCLNLAEFRPLVPKPAKEQQ